MPTVVKKNQSKTKKAIKGGNLYQSSAKLEDCSNKSCATASAKNDRSPATMKLNKEKEILKKAVYANKLDYETYKKRVSELQKAVDNSQEARDLIACSLGSCSQETRNYVVNVAKGFAKACKGGVETSCPKAQKVQEIKKKPMNVNSFLEISGMFSR